MTDQRRQMYLELVEHTVLALRSWKLRRREDQPPYRGLHEELLEHGVQVACGPSILQPHERGRLPTPQVGLIQVVVCAGGG